MKDVRRNNAIYQNADKPFVAALGKMSWLSILAVWFDVTEPGSSSPNRREKRQCAHGDN
jgi:hypothetical protein